jgi:6,7-dimethyl-8-ribityllumazine synthase
MAKVIEGNLIAQDKKFGIVASRFNDFITRRLLDGCLDTLTRHGAKNEDIEIVWTPGSFEIPLVAQKMAKSRKYDSLICLGTIIRGDTPHFEYIASQAARGVAKVAYDTGLPCVFGIITAETIEQAIERAGTKDGNKGRDAALSAIEMANLVDKLVK